MSKLLFWILRWATVYNSWQEIHIAVYSTFFIGRILSIIKQYLLPRSSIVCGIVYNWTGTEGTPKIEGWFWFQYSKARRLILVPLHRWQSGRWFMDTCPSSAFVHYSLCDAEKAWIAQQKTQLRRNNVHYGRFLWKYPSLIFSWRQSFVWKNERLFNRREWTKGADQ